MQKIGRHFANLKGTVLPHCHFDKAMRRGDISLRSSTPRIVTGNFHLKPQGAESTYLP